jgi:hypothetical protein
LGVIVAENHTQNATIQFAVCGSFRYLQDLFFGEDPVNSKACVIDSMGEFIFFSFAVIFLHLVPS